MLCNNGGPKKKDVKIHLDGPFGNYGLNLNEFESVVIFAGGMGITPMISIYSDLMWRHERGELPNLKRCRLVFASRNAAQFTWFQSVYDRSDRSTPFECEFYLTSSKTQDGGSSFTRRVGQGRPNIDKIIEESSKSSRHVEQDEENTKTKSSIKPLMIAPAGERAAEVKTQTFSCAVLTCGPKSMMDAAHDSAWSRGMAFHKETYKL